MPTGILERTDDICRGKRRDAGIGSGEVIGDGKKRGVALLLLFFALAMLVRAPGLGRWCLAVDEFYFSKAVSFILEKGLPMFPGGGYYTRGIGLQYLTTLPVSLIGNPELAVRIVPLLFGCMTIPLFFLFCRKFMGESESILCTIILLLSSWHIELSRFARMYMPFQFFFFLFLYHVHSGFRENMPRHRLAAWIVATLTVFVYEGSVIPALLLAALVLTGDAGKSKKDLALFMALFLGLLALNLAANLPDYRSMGVPEAELVATAPPLPAPPAAPASTSSAPDDSPVLLPNPGLLAFAFRSWMGRVLLALFACAGVWLTARSVRRYEGPFPKAILLVSLFPLPLLPLLHQYALLAVFVALLAMNRRDIRQTVGKDLPYWGIYVLLSLMFWILVVVKSGNLHRIMSFFVGYPPIKYSVVAPFMQATPLWMVFLFGTAAFSILRNVLFRRWEEDTFPITILILCLALVPVFKTLYQGNAVQFLLFPAVPGGRHGGDARNPAATCPRRYGPSSERRAGSLLLTIPLAVFLSTEDFHVHHVVDVSAPALNFRTGPLQPVRRPLVSPVRLQDPGAFRGRRVRGRGCCRAGTGRHVAVSGETVLQLRPGGQRTIRGNCTERGHARAMVRPPPDIGPPTACVEGPGERTELPLDHRGRVGLPRRATEFGDQISRSSDEEFGLGVDLAFVGIDGRTGVWRMRREIAGEAANPGTHQHGAKERNNS